MRRWKTHRALPDAAAALRMTVVAASAAVVLVGCGATGDGQSSQKRLAVAKASCGPDDRAETGLQGQIPMADRTAGFRGFNCNLEKTAATHASRGNGSWQQFASVRDRAGRTCGFAGGAFRSNVGTVVVDLTDPNHSVETALLMTPAMQNPGEGLRAHTGRGLLVSAFYAGLPSEEAVTKGFDVYDVGTDCRHPKLLASTTLAFPTTGLPESPGAGPWPNPDYSYGHEGAFAPDGLTYYISDFPHALYHAVDLTDAAAPKILSSFQSPSYVNAGPLMQGGVHGLSLSKDGNRAYVVSFAYMTGGGIVPPGGEWHNGFLVVDTSEVQARKPHPRMRLISEVNMRDASAQQMTIPMRIKGKPYVIALGEAGTGQANGKGLRAACAAGKTPFGMVHIFDVSDEANPQFVNKIVLEVNDPANCSTVLPEVSTVKPFYDVQFVYDVHMCSVDNRDETTTLACGYFQSGIRVYDVRDPQHIKEIAYFNPAAKGPGNYPGWCGAIPILDADAGMLYSSCSDSGIVSLKFRKGVWPFPETKTPADGQL